MTHELFAHYIADLCARSPLAKQGLFWTIIANPRAGGFTIRSRWERHLQALEAAAQETWRTIPLPSAAPSQTARKESAAGLILTTGPGHAAAITRELVAEVSVFAEISAHAEVTANGEKAGGTGLFLIITAGGDGTSLEVLSEISAAPEAVRSRVAVLRLPMGTGNDGADARELGGTLDLLIKPAEPVFTRALRLVTSTPGKGPFPAFNILSVGLDAFVTHMTNKMKGRLPGDFYKLWVDIAALFYDKIYKVGYMDIRAFNEEGNEIQKRREKILLMAVGASGHRTYGSNKRILPDDRNVCAVRQMPLLRKLALKDQFTTGTHITQPESLLFTASRIEFSAEHPILAQMDGETVLLETRDFPAAIELTAPVVPVLRLL